MIFTYLSKYPSPQKWESPDNPPFPYYAYTLWHNIQQINTLRKKKGLSIFTILSNFSTMDIYT